MYLASRRDLRCRGADVDASAVLFGKQLNVLDTVWSEKRHSTCGSVTHSRDDLTRVGDGDDEVISVRLTEIPHYVHYLLFTASVPNHSHPFNKVVSRYEYVLLQ